MEMKFFELYKNFVCVLELFYDRMAVKVNFLKFFSFEKWTNDKQSSVETLFETKFIPVIQLYYAH